MGCNHKDCDTCPYPDCILTEREAVKRNKEDGMSCGWDTERVSSREREYQKEYQKKYREEHRAELSAKQRERYYEKKAQRVPKEKKTTNRNEYYRTYYKQNKARYRAIREKYYESHKDILLEKARIKREERKNARMQQLLQADNGTSDDLQIPG